MLECFHRCTNSSASCLHITQPPAYPTQPVLRLFGDRWTVCFTPAVAIAHLLNPANIGQYDDPLLMEKAEEYIRETFDKEAAPKVISSLWCFVNKSGGFTDEMFAILTAGTPPVVWWSQCPFGAQHEELRSLALKLLHVPATSAASERNWSAFRFIHTRLRNRLRSTLLNLPRPAKKQSMCNTTVPK